MGGMRFWFHIYIFNRKMESILNELKKNIFDFRIYFNTVARACAYFMCEGGSREGSLGTTRLRVYGGVDVRLCAFLLWELGIA
jgi:hypothetical protein